MTWSNVPVCTVEHVQYIAKTAFGIKTTVWVNASSAADVIPSQGNECKEMLHLCTNIALKICAMRWHDMKGQPNRDLNPVPPSQGSNHSTNWANEAGPNIAVWGPQSQYLNWWQWVRIAIEYYQLYRYTKICIMITSAKSIEIIELLQY